MKLRQLLVVIDPSQPEQPALQRAALLARASGAAIELLLVEHQSALEGSLLLTPQLQTRAREALLAELDLALEGHARPLRDEGLRVTVQVRWGKPLHRMILARIDELQPDLVFKSARHHGLLKQLLLGNSCWQLIRKCPVPLWLVQHRDWQGRRLCAALDPLHQADKPAALDHLLIAAARELATGLGLEDHYLHSHAALPHSLLFDAELIADYESYKARCAAQHRDAFEQVLAPYAIADERCHLVEGFAEQTLPNFVREQGIDLLLMGAIARGQLDNALIGNTAERVLEAVDCDLLVLKMPSASAQQR